MNVIELNKFRHCAESILFIFVDLQVEYISEGRAYYLENTASCLANVQLLMSSARKLKLPIAHFRRTTKTQFFNKETHFANWIPEFNPRASEMVFEREDFSCYGNTSFCQFLDQVKDPTLILAGFTGEHSCLATAIDSSRRKHNLIYVADASSSKPLEGLPAGDAHIFVTNLVNEYAQVAGTKEILSTINSRYKRPLVAVL